MSTYSRIQFCLGDDELPKVELRRHPEVPVLMLTLSYDRGELTLDATPERLRGFLIGLLAHPLLAPPPTPQASETPERWCPVGCGAHEDPGPWHQRGCARWRAEAVESFAQRKPAASETPAGASQVAPVGHPEHCCTSDCEHPAQASETPPHAQDSLPVKPESEPIVKATGLCDAHQGEHAFSEATCRQWREAPAEGEVWSNFKAWIDLAERRGCSRVSMRLSDARALLARGITAAQAATIATLREERERERRDTHYWLVRLGKVFGHPEPISLAKAVEDGEATIGILISEAATLREEVERLRTALTRAVREQHYDYAADEDEGIPADQICGACGGGSPCTDPECWVFEAQTALSPPQANPQASTTTQGR